MARPPVNVINTVSSCMTGVRCSALISQFARRSDLPVPDDSSSPVTLDEARMGSRRRDRPVECCNVVFRRKFPQQ